MSSSSSTSTRSRRKSRAALKRRRQAGDEPVIGREALDRRHARFPRCHRCFRHRPRSARSRRARNCASAASAPATMPASLSTGTTEVQRGAWYVMEPESAVALKRNVACGRSWCAGSSKESIDAIASRPGHQPRIQAWYLCTHPSTFSGACARFQAPAAYLLASASVG